jgi:hypothetical protein
LKKFKINMQQVKDAVIAREKVKACPVCSNLLNQIKEHSQGGHKLES